MCIIFASRAYTYADTQKYIAPETYIKYNLTRKEQNHSNVATQSYRVFVEDSQLPLFYDKGHWHFYFMNKYQKSILLTAANIAIIGFSAVAATTATVAWFQFSDVLTAEGMSIECLSADRSVEWNILRYDEEVKSGVLSHDENDFHLPSYDQYITTKNIYSNVILAATVITPTGLSSVEQVYVDITCTGGLKGQDGKILALTSNVFLIQGFHKHKR